ncbi:uncharacterized protein BDV14DRAFT_199847 [Aspergillus stella-maris]|uniref:uncharacterized protein n=1 Tax=Aspergillus stella-maris TaxID=1810926 RepID=UPI003CCCA1F3
MVHSSKRRGRGAPHPKGPQRGESKQQPCRDFVNGNCRRKGKCRFSHEGTPAARSTRAEPPEESPAKEKYRQWKRLPKHYPSAASTHGIQRFWKTALEVLALGDQDTSQRILRDLSDGSQTNGLQWVGTTMEVLLEVNGGLDIARSFLEVITSSAFLDCLSSDRYLEDLYTFLGDSNGTRAVPSFLRVCKSLSQHNDKQECSLIANALTTALHQAVICNQRVLFHDDFAALLDAVGTVCDNTGSRSNLSSITAKTLLRELRRLKKRAGGALGDSKAVNHPATKITRKTLSRPSEFPGSHHDNDHQDIVKIKIIPTEGGIRSEKAEYLPSSNFESRSFLEGSERLIDTHFRLLRHDIFDEVKKTVSELLYVLDKEHDIAQWIRSASSNKSIHAYEGARVSRVEFSKKQALEAYISFVEPIRITKKSTSEKLTWWKETRRLSEGSLVCLVSLRNGISSAFLLSVTRNITNSKELGSLVQEKGHHARIVCSLVPRHQAQDLETLVRLEHDKSDDRAVLIEFRNVILGTFTPILENLQRMYKETQLRFADWIVPSLERTTPGSSMPTHLYARQADFTFCLYSILKDKAQSLSMTPANIDPEFYRKLAEPITLDSGQCEALISALSREFTSLKLVNSERYETVTKEELESIKRAMFAVGECGMPMGRARCPECGAAVGGANHWPDEGVTRAVEMEDDN